MHILADLTLEPAMSQSAKGNCKKHKTIKWKQMKQARIYLQFFKNFLARFNPK
jgi:hypothetical protein